MARTPQTSIRFDPEKLEMVKKREKLATTQKVVDFLMDAYWWRHKLVSLPENDALAPKLIYVTPSKPKTQQEQYEDEIRGADDAYALTRTMQFVEKDKVLSNSDKEKLKKIALEKAQEFQY